MTLSGRFVSFTTIRSAVPVFNAKIIVDLGHVLLQLDFIMLTFFSCRSKANMALPLALPMGRLALVTVIASMTLPATVWMWTWV